MKTKKLAKRLWEKFGFIASLLVCAAFVAASALISQSAGTKTKNEAPLYAASPFENEIIHSVSQAKQTVQEKEGIYDENKIAAKDGEMMFYPSVGVYRVHSGVDILCDKALCFEDGTVTEVFAEPFMGLSVKVLTQTGVRLYSSLESVSVKEGDRLQKGEEIGVCGISLMEEHLGVHLHTEFMPSCNE